MTTITIRLTEKEQCYLEQLITNKNLFKSTKKVTPGKVLKSLLRWCCECQFNPSEQAGTHPTSSQKLLEQMHLSIPHILYLLRLHVLMDSDKITDQIVKSAKSQALEYINTVCGDFQNVEYQKINPVIGEEGIKKLPAEEGMSNWKLK